MSRLRDTPADLGTPEADAPAVDDLVTATLEQLRASLPLLRTVAEIAEVARGSPSSVRRAIASGQLPFNQRRSGGAIFVPRDAVLSWAFSLDLGRQPAAAQSRKSPRRAASAGGKAGKRRPPLRLTAGGPSAERLTPAAMRDFAARYGD